MGNAKKTGRQGYAGKGIFDFRKLFFANFLAVSSGDVPIRKCVKFVNRLSDIALTSSILGRHKGTQKLSKMTNQDERECR